MKINIGDVKKISTNRTSSLFANGKTKVTGMTMFIDFEKINGLYINIDRKTAVKLMKDIQKHLDYELKR